MIYIYITGCHALLCCNVVSQLRSKHTHACCDNCQGAGVVFYVTETSHAKSQRSPTLCRYCGWWRRGLWQHHPNQGLTEGGITGIASYRMGQAGSNLEAKTPPPQTNGQRINACTLCSLRSEPPRCSLDIYEIELFRTDCSVWSAKFYFI